MTSATRFGGFSLATYVFLGELAENNQRDWFNSNKARYESDVRTPALNFITAMGPELAKISKHFCAVPGKTGGSLMRPYRDTRFSHDKTPYKTNIGIQFRHDAGKDVHAPGYYLHIEPSGCFMGVGLWRPDSASMGAIRARIDEKPDAWLTATRKSPFTRHYALGGERLKRPPRGFTDEHPLIDDLKRKDFIAVHDIQVEKTQGPGFVRYVTARFNAAEPMMRFLCTALGLPF